MKRNLKIKCQLKVFNGAVKMYTDWSYMNYGMTLLYVKKHFTVILFIDLNTFNFPR